MNILGLVDIYDWVLFLVGILIAVYIHATWHFDYFKSRGIPCAKPYPFLGTITSIFTVGLVEGLKQRCNEYGKVSGSFRGRRPAFVIGDDDILREILVKQFHNFQNRSRFGLVDDLLGRMVSIAEDDDWRRIRNAMTPLFTSGKLKMMTRSIDECAQILVDNLSSVVEGGDPEVEMGSICKGYVMDVIGRVGFGIKVDSQNQKENMFVKMANKVGKLNSFTNPRTIAAFFMPFLNKPLNYLGFTLVPKDSVNFFENVMEQAIAGRQETDGLLVNQGKKATSDAELAKIQKEVEEQGGQFDQKSIKTGLSKQEIVAQGILFFIAGNETTTSGISFLCHCLATNPECQEILYQEILEKAGNREDVDYQTINSLSYLDMCMQESLRLYPPAIITDRVSKADVVIKGVEFPKDMIVAIPIISIHYYKEVWPDPERFDPERFTPENKEGRSPFAWMPFGYGPRHCIAMRLAILQVKVAVVELIRNFKLEPSRKTQVPIKFANKGTITAKDGIWVNMIKRNAWA